MKRFQYIITAIVAFALVVSLTWAGTVHKLPYGVATPEWYGYSSGAKSTYYLEHPTLTANDQVVVEGVAQTLTNKTLTTPTVTSIKDASGNISYSTGTSIPTATTAGYSIGSEFLLTSALLGQSSKWINQGSASSCLFVPVGPVISYGVAWITGPVDCVNGAAGTSYPTYGSAQTDIPFAGHVISDDDDQIIGVTMDTGKETCLITGSADPLTTHDYSIFGIRNKCTPTWDIVAAGEYDAVTDDDVTVAITVADVLATDFAFAVHVDTDDNDTISDVICTADTVTITVSADPEVAHSYNYMVLRQRGTFKPSHYIAYAGQFEAVGGDAVEAATVAGVLAADLIYTVSSDAASGDAHLEKVVLTADTITWTYDADPTAGHKIAYAVLRAY